MSNTDPANTSPERLYALRVPETLTPEQFRQLGSLAAALGIEMAPIEPNNDTHAAVSELITARRQTPEITPSEHLPAFHHLLGAVDTLGRDKRRRQLTMVYNPYPPMTDKEIATYAAEGYDSVTYLRGTLVGRYYGGRQGTMRVFRRTNQHEGTVVKAEIDVLEAAIPQYRETIEVSASGATIERQSYQEKGFGPWSTRELKPAEENSARPVSPDQITDLGDLIESGILTHMEHWSQTHGHWATSRSN